MAPAIPAFRAALAKVSFSVPHTPVVSSMTAQPLDDPRRRLLAGLTNPVRWRETMLYLNGLGVRRFVDAGPGKVLAGLVTRTLSAVTVETTDSLEAARA
jgi:[acyl-carrier-protein] S-malonyltransferase